MSKVNELQTSFAGLQPLPDSVFPKRCRGCGHEYATATEFIAVTHAPRPGSSGLKEGRDDDDQCIVELFRNCLCGSTLLVSFQDRRDHSETGLRRRQRYDEDLSVRISTG